jgi:nicotinate-nucleotide--dimethylbenzimidazole phosphoribosyltransferase
MPAGALGRLLGLGQQLCAIQQTLTPRTQPAAVLVMAADHGIAEEGVSAYPQAVTGQMVRNFLRGGAAINVLARRQQAQVLVVDMGVRREGHPTGGANLPLGAGQVENLPPHEKAQCLDYSIAWGTANFLHGPAMTRQQAEQAVAAGRRVVAEHLAARGVKVLGLGDMGIGNTTSASALTAALTGLPPADVTGRGTGVDDSTYRRKIDVVKRAVRLHFPDLGPRVDPMDALSAVGGFEIAGLVGACLEAAARRMVAVLDGFISSVAGLLAFRLDPNVRGYCVASHRSVERGHQFVLERLELTPLLDLGLRLGEGSGAALALPLLASAADLMCDMATFDDAGVSNEVSPITSPPATP